MTGGTDWKADRECANVDPDLFFPQRGEDSRKAKAVCRGCTVVDMCLEYALRNGEKFGVWGGKTERERREIRRARGMLAGRGRVSAAHLDRHPKPWCRRNRSSYSRGCRCVDCCAAEAVYGYQKRGTPGAA